MNQFLYKLLYHAARLFSRLPFRVLYILSDFVFFIAYCCIGYRRKVVQTNLRNSFPNKSKAELTEIERKFYHNLCDYFFETIKLLDMNEKEMLKLINDDWPIYTMTNDSCPTLYKPGAKVTGSIVANGCQIEGTVINSVIGRNVVIKEGAVVKDSVILPDTLIDKNVTLENGVVDRLSIVTHIKDLKGTKEEPIYIKRGDRI